MAWLLLKKKIMQTFWKNLPVPIRAILSGVAVTLSLIIPWGAMFQANIAGDVNMPWSAGAIVVYVFFWWRSVNRRLKKTGQDKTISSGYTSWRWAFIIGGLVTAGLYILLLLTMQVFKLDTAKGFDFSKISTLPFFLYALAGSAVAAIAEETGYRGYMQQILLRKYKFVQAVSIVAVVFALGHLINPNAVYFLLLYIIASVNYSFIVKATGSLVPAIILHFLVNFASYCFIWMNRAKPAAEINVVIWTGIALMLILLGTIIGFFKLRKPVEQLALHG